MLITTNRICINADSVVIEKCSSGYRVSAHNGRIIQTLKIFKTEAEAMELFEKIKNKIIAKYPDEQMHIE